MKTPTIRPTTGTMTVLAIVAGLLFVTGILVYTVGSRSQRAATAQLQDKQKQVEDSTKIAKRLTEAQNTYLKSKSEIALLETSVSTHAYVPTLLGQLEHLGKSHNLKVTSVRPQQAPAQAPAPVKKSEGESSDEAKKTDSAKSEQAKPYEELQIDIQIEGTYWNIHNFVQSLTRFPKIIAVKAIQMSPIQTANKPGSPSLQVTLIVTAFIFKEEELNIKPSGSGSTPPETKSAALINGRSNSNG